MAPSLLRLSHLAGGGDLLYMSEITVAMAAAAAADPRAVALLAEAAAAPLRFVMRRHLADMGWANPPEDALYDVVMSGVLALHDLAPAWVPGSALPWRWADRRLRAIAAAYVGQHADGIEVLERMEARSYGVASSGVSATEALATVAEDNELARLLLVALRCVANERDVELWLEVRQEAACGNRAPAVTVGTYLGLAPTTVRKAAQRVSERLSRLAVADDTFGPLLMLPCIRPVAA